MFIVVISKSLHVYGILLYTKEPKLENLSYSNMFTLSKVYRICNTSIYFEYDWTASIQNTLAISTWIDTRSRGFQAIIHNKEITVYFEEQVNHYGGINSTEYFYIKLDDIKFPLPFSIHCSCVSRITL